MKQGKNTIVQCHGRVSRSATIVIAFLMKVKKMTLNEAYTFLKEKRSRVKPNQGFWAQLEQYEKELLGDQVDEEKYLTPTKN